MTAKTTSKSVELPIRIGVFSSVAEADRALDDLLSGAGFTEEQITVVCSESPVKRHFVRFEHQEPAGTETPAAAAAGGVIGAALGGLAAVAGLSTLGGVPLLAAGGLALWTGGVVGGLVGAMMTRGVEKELANYYDQALTEGKILVAVEEKSPQHQDRLEQAADILSRHGVLPMPLREG